MCLSLMSSPFPPGFIKSFPSETALCGALPLQQLWAERQNTCFLSLSLPLSFSCRLSGPQKALLQAFQVEAPIYLLFSRLILGFLLSSDAEQGYGASACAQILSHWVWIMDRLRDGAMHLKHTQIKAVVAGSVLQRSTFSTTHIS